MVSRLNLPVISGLHRQSTISALLILFLSPCSHITLAGEAVPDETVPPYHWITKVAILLVDAGVIDLDLSSRPFTRGELAITVAKAANYKHSTSTYASCLLTKLEGELKSEIEELKSSYESVEREKQVVGKILNAKGFDTPWLWRAGAYLSTDFTVKDEDGFDIEGIAVSKVGVRPLPAVYAYNGSRFDSYLSSDTSYEGKAWGGMAGYVEQAYLTLRYKRLSGWIGRNWLRFGPGRTGALLLSDNSRPFTGIHLALDMNPVIYRWGAFELDKRWDLNRYMSVHRLEWKIGGNISIAVSEMMIYAGAARSWELKLLNPIAVWQFEQYAETEGNGIFSADLSWRAVRNLTIGAEFMVDDIQIEKETSKDLEPNEIGGLITAVWSDPVGIPGSRWTFEAAAITQRTYNSLHTGEKGLHYLRPIGWRGGNDVIDWYLRWDHVPESRVIAGWDIEYECKGENRISAPFDTTYRSHTVEEGYSEPFPTGTVRRTLRIGIDGMYQPRPQTLIELRASRWFAKNAAHIDGLKDDGWLVRLRLVLNVDASRYVKGR